MSIEIISLKKGNTMKRVYTTGYPDMNYDNSRALLYSEPNIIADTEQYIEMYGRNTDEEEEEELVF